MSAPRLKETPESPAVALPASPSRRPVTADLARSLTPLAKAVEAYRNSKADLAASAYTEVWRKRASGEAIDVEAFCAQFGSVRERVQEMVEANVFFEENLPLVEEQPEAVADLPNPVRKRPENIAWPRASETFLNFTLLTEMGSGNFARVFLAREPNVGDRLVVVKISLNGGPEAKILGKLEHPNVVPIHSVQEDEATQLTAVCMPYVANDTLQDILQKVQSLPELPTEADAIFDAIRDDSTVVADSASLQLENLRRGTYVNAIRIIGEQIADALEFIHENKILHRDLKPSNILVNRNATPMLIDFNLSADPRVPEARVGGTPTYMPPEQLLASREETHALAGPIDNRSDIYSLGVILYKLLTGRHPFAPLPDALTLDDCIATLLEKQRAGIITNVRELNPDVDEPFAQVIHQCLAYNPAKRPQSAAEVARALHRDNPAPQVKRRPIRQRLHAMAAVVLSLLAVGAVAAAVWTSRPPESERRLADGLEAYRQKRFQDAVQQFNAALSADPKSPNALFARGRAYQQMGLSDSQNFSLALADYRDAQKLSDEGKIHAGIGYCMSRLGFTDMAKLSYQKAIDLGFESAALYNNMGLGFLKYGKTYRKEALDSFAKAISLDPGIQAPYHNRAVLYCDKAFNELAAAEGKFKSRKLSPEAFGRVQSEILHDLEEGMEDLKKAFARGPSNPDLCFDAARLYATAARLDPRWTAKALEYLTDSLKEGLNPSDIALDISFVALKDVQAFKNLAANTSAETVASPILRLLDPISDF